ncbi:MAG: PAS domain S-box protein [Bacteroidales bacterium]|nr:MAG: PAS domain S-box protein [Bacteroidales bacterium]
MENKREFVTQITILAAIISLLFPISAVFINLLILDDFTYTFKDFAGLYSENPVHWIILSLILIIPVTTYLTTRYFANVIDTNQKRLSSERNKTRRIQDFTKTLIQEDFSQEFEVSEDDSLGKSLLNLRDKLKSNKETEVKRRKEDEQRNWTAEGLAKFGDILRNEIDNLELLSFNVIKELTKYIDATQGGFYILKDGEGKAKYFDMTAFFAYDRKKYADKQVKWGDGLIGTCALEKKSIYIADVPNDYVSVTSGLGYTNPKSLLIVPLIKEEELFGVIEFASLNIIEPHQLEFVEKVAENIASTLSLANINIKTTKLLEETKAQTEALASQEEEMRQNMEELQSTQEEATRQAERFILLENTINHTMIRAEFDKEGKLIYANTIFLKKLEYNLTEEVDGKHVSEFIDKKDRVWFAKIWDKLVKGGKHFEGYMKHITKTGKNLWTMATYTCVRHEDDEVDKILFLALDTSEHKDESLKMEGIIDSVERSGIKVELDINGNIVDFNEAFLLLFEYASNEIKSLSIFDLVNKLEIEGFSKKWDNVIKGIGFQGQFKVRTKKDAEKWIRGAFSSAYNVHGDIDRIFFTGQDITKEKNMETSINDQTEILMNQERLIRDAKKELSKKIREVKLDMAQEYEIIQNIKIRNEQILEGSLDAIVTISSDNKIIFFNPAAEDLWGYKREEVLNSDIGILFSNKIIDKDEFVAALVGPGDNKIINARNKIKILTSSNKEKDVIIFLAKAKTEEEISYTAFIQNIG